MHYAKLIAPLTHTGRLWDNHTPVNKATAKIYAGQVSTEIATFTLYSFLRLV